MVSLIKNLLVIASGGHQQQTSHHKSYGKNDPQIHFASCHAAVTYIMDVQHIERCTPRLIPQDCPKSGVKP